MNEDEKIGPKFIDQKKYGLIIPSKKPINTSKPQKLARSCVFDDDDELEDDEPKEQKPKVKTNDSHIKRQTQIMIEKALAEDPDVFDYDASYEKDKEEREKLNPKNKDKSKEPKYVAGLLKAAALKQLEYERRQDRKVQKEREVEGELFKDKESFVTETYRKRMEEKQKIEEEERRQDRIEALLDVTKQKDLSGFYDSLLKMKSGELLIEEESEKIKRLEKERLEKEAIKNKFLKKPATHVKTTTYRARKEESSDEEEEKEEIKANVKDSSIEKENVESESNDIKNDEPEAKRMKTEESIVKEQEENNKAKSKQEQKESIANSEKVEEKPMEKPETKAERWARLFNKRHCGDLFDKELTDYYKRKSEILALKLYIERE